MIWSLIVGAFIGMIAGKMTEKASPWVVLLILSQVS